MTKFLFSLSLLFIGLNPANAQLLSGCVMSNGSLLHKVSKQDDKLIGQFNFPYYRDLQKDPSGQTLSLTAPLSNDVVFSDGLDFLHEKKLFLAKIFGQNFSLKVEFDFCEQQQSSDKKFNARFCIKNGPFKINNINLQTLEFSIQNQVRTSLSGSEGQVKQTDVVYADLLFTTTANSGGLAKAYKSSFTYYPNGNSVQCFLN